MCKKEIVRSPKRLFKKLFGRRGATSPAPSATQSMGMLRPSARLQAFSKLTFPTDIQPPEQGSAKRGLAILTGTTTQPCTPTSPSTDHDQAPRLSGDTKPTDHQQPAATLKAPPRALDIEPQAEPKATESIDQPISALSTSQRLWDTAYNSLAEGKDTAELVRSYLETLDKVLGNKTCEPSTVGVSITLKDSSQRQAHMRKLVEEGQAKLFTQSKVIQGVGDAVQFLSSVKPMIDLAIQNIPQAALPWAGVCIGLQVHFCVRTMK